MARQVKGILGGFKGSIGGLVGMVRNGEYIIREQRKNKSALTNLDPALVNMVPVNYDKTEIVDNNVFSNGTGSSYSFTAQFPLVFESSKILLQTYEPNFQKSRWFLFRVSGDGYNYSNCKLCCQIKYNRLLWYSYGKQLSWAQYSYSYQYWRVSYYNGVFTGYASVTGDIWFKLISFDFEINGSIGIALNPSGPAGRMLDLKYKKYKTGPLVF